MKLLHGHLDTAVEVASSGFQISTPCCRSSQNTNITSTLVAPVRNRLCKNSKINKKRWSRPFAGLVPFHPTVPYGIILKTHAMPIQSIREREGWYDQLAIGRVSDKQAVVDQRFES
jgi:hypothetical protein